MLNDMRDVNDEGGGRGIYIRYNGFNRGVADVLEYFHHHLPRVFGGYNKSIEPMIHKETR